MKTAEQQPRTTRKVRILSIDGGGIRGIIPAVVLSRLEKKLQKLTGNDDARLSDFFDLVAGTSTGGILACYYTCPKTRMEGAEAAVALYREKGKEIFSTSLLRRIRAIFYKSRYAERNIETILCEKFGSATLNDIERVHLLIPAYDPTIDSARFYSTESARKNDKNRDFKLRDIARATSAAPTYFSAKRLLPLSGKEIHCMVDGGIFANNPAMCAITEAGKIRFDFLDGKVPEIEDIFMLSLGTGDFTVGTDERKLMRRGALGWATTIIDMLMYSSAEIVTHQVEKMFEKGKCKKDYYRFQPCIQLSKLGIEGIVSSEGGMEIELTAANCPDRNMDNTSEKNIEALEYVGNKLADVKDEKLDTIARKLIEYGGLCEGKE